MYYEIILNLKLRIYNRQKPLLIDFWNTCITQMAIQREFHGSSKLIDLKLNTKESTQIFT